MGSVRQQLCAVFGASAGLVWALGSTGLLKVAWVQTLVAFTIGITLPVFSSQIYTRQLRSKSRGLPLPAVAGGRAPVIVELARESVEEEFEEEEEEEEGCEEEAGFDEEAPADPEAPEAELARPEAGGAEPEAQEEEEEAEEEEEREQAREGAVGFRPEVLAEVIPNLRLMDKKSKSKLWWQPEDFAEFLRVRVLIGRAYHAVAKRRGVAVDSDFPPEPVLSHESRLGLCLGRQEERVQARRRYMSAVLREQARQLSPTNGGRRRGQDLERLASVAWQASKAERRFAAEQAARHRQKVLKDLEQEASRTPGAPPHHSRSGHRLAAPGTPRGLSGLASWPMGRAVSVSCGCELEINNSEHGNNDSDGLELDGGKCVRSVTEGSRPVGADGDGEPETLDATPQDTPAEATPRPLWWSEGTTAESMSEMDFSSSEDAIFVDFPSGSELEGPSVPTLDLLATPSTSDSRGFGLSLYDLKRVGVSPTGHLLRSYLPTPVRSGRAAKDPTKGGGSHPGARSKVVSAGRAAESEDDGEGNSAETASTGASTASVNPNLEQASGDDGWDSACEGGSEQAEDGSEG